MGQHTHSGGRQPTVHFIPAESFTATLFLLLIAQLDPWAAPQHLEWSMDTIQVMVRNAIQCKAGLSVPDFQKFYGMED